MESLAKLMELVWSSGSTLVSWIRVEATPCRVPSELLKRPVRHGSRGRCLTFWRLGVYPTAIRYSSGSLYTSLPNDLRDQLRKYLRITASVLLSIRPCSVFGVVPEQTNQDMIHHRVLVQLDRTVLGTHSECILQRIQHQGCQLRLQMLRTTHAHRRHIHSGVCQPIIAWCFHGSSFS